MNASLHIYICFNIRDLGPGDFAGPLAGPSSIGPRATSPMPDARRPLPEARRPLPGARCLRPSGSDFWVDFRRFWIDFRASGPYFSGLFAAFGQRATRYWPRAPNFAFFPKMPVEMEK